MAPRKSAGNRKNEPMADVVTRRSRRIAGVGTKSDSIVGTGAWEVTKPKRRRQASPSRGGKNVAVPAVHQGISSVSGGRPPRIEPNASIDSARNASRAPRNSRISTGDTPRPTSKARSGAVSVSRAAKGARETPRGDEGGDSPPVARNGLRIDDGTPIPNENLDAADQARSKDRTSASPVAHVSETGASRGQKRRSQDAQNDDPPSVTGKRTRKSTEHPPPRGGIGAPSKPPSEDPGHETSPPGPRGQRFSDILLRAVVVNRALSETQDRYEGNDRRISDLRRQIALVQEEFNTNWLDQSEAEQDIGRRIENLEALLPEPERNKEIASRKKQYLVHQRNTCIDQLRGFDVNREDDGLEFLAGSNDLWRDFLYFRARVQRISDLDTEIAQTKRELRIMENTTERLYRRVFDFGHASLVSARAEADIFEGMDDLPDVIDRLRSLELDKPELERLMKNQALHVLESAEEAFVSSGILVHGHVLYSRDGSGQEDSEGYGRVRDGRVESDRPWERARSRHMYVPASLTPGRWAPGSYVSFAQNVGHLPGGIYIDRSGRRWVRNTPGKDSPPAELSTREKFNLAKSNLQKARAEFEGARYLIQSEIRDLPRPVTEEAKGIAAVQKLGRRTRALTDAILAYKDTYEQARKAGLTEGGEKTADFTEREDDGHADSVWEQIIASGKARVPLDWDGLHLIPQEASPTREELDQSLRRLLSPRLGEDSTHVAAANSRYRERIDDLLIEGYNVREEGSFPEAEADELVFE